MGNWFSNRTRYTELVQEVSDMDNYFCLSSFLFSQ